MISMPRGVRCPDSPILIPTNLHHMIRKLSVTLYLRAEAVTDLHRGTDVCFGSPRQHAAAAVIHHNHEVDIVGSEGTRCS